MRTFILLSALMGLTAVAHADISDSGNLSIGGQAVISGTMTVEGNAFSVGGSTFAVSGGTTQVGGLLKISSQGIQWSDGTVSTNGFASNGFGSSSFTYTTISGSDIIYSNSPNFSTLSGSTISFSPRGASVDVSFSAPIENRIGAGQAIFLRVLMNGSPVGPQSWCLHRMAGSATEIGMCARKVRISGLTPNTSYAFTVQVKTTSSECYVDCAQGCWFEAREVF